ncbi:MAG: hypothetical protein PWR10_1274 [Halanaerobiales bacterium]|nr:hypothetical protein [Halanaerobiales bacterium]
MCSTLNIFVNIWYDDIKSINFLRRYIIMSDFKIEMTIKITDESGKVE